VKASHLVKRLRYLIEENGDCEVDMVTDLEESEVEEAEYSHQEERIKLYPEGV